MAFRSVLNAVLPLPFSRFIHFLHSVCERDLRILSKTDLGRRHAEYQVVADQPHHHVIYQGCGQVMDLDHTY